MRPFIFALTLLFIFCTSLESNAQLRNLGKKLKKKVEDRVDRKVDRAADKGLDEVEEGIEESVTGDGEEPSQDQPDDSGPSNGDIRSGGGNDSAGSGEMASSGDFRVNTKFDYVPGERLMVFDDFSADAIGDFPSRWNTDGTGEVVTFGDSNDKWFLMKSGSDYIPDLPEELPESFTIEFDLTARGLDRTTPSSTVLEVILDNNNQFKHSVDRAIVRIPFCQYHPVGFYVRSFENGRSLISNSIEGDIRSDVLNQPHISIAVNKTRFRLWVNHKKYVDVPRLIPTGGVTYLKFRPYYFRDGKEDIFIRNLKIAEGGLDLRSQLLAEGKVSTNGILFDVNSATIKPESYGVIRQIALAMQEKGEMKLTIIGHTDSDGTDEDNMNLSQRRAESVKNALVNDFEIDAARLQTEGKGESVPVAGNDSPEGKAANRRVEFVSL